MEKRKEPRWYILWFITSGMWTIIFCRNFFFDGMREWITVIQFLNIGVSFAAGIVNVKRYKKRHEEEE